MVSDRLAHHFLIMRRPGRNAHETALGKPVAGALQAGKPELKHFHVSSVARRTPVTMRMSRSTPGPGGRVSASASDWLW